MDRYLVYLLLSSWQDRLDQEIWTLDRSLSDHQRTKVDLRGLISMNDELKFEVDFLGSKLNSDE